MGYRAEYGRLLEEIAIEADEIALKYFRTVELRAEKKKDGTTVTEADCLVEEMARKRVAGSQLDLDVLGEEMGGGSEAAPAPGARPRLIIDPIDGTEEFSRGIPTFGTLLGIEVGGEIVAAMARKRVAASQLDLDVLGEEMGGGSEAAPAPGARPRLIIDPIDRSEER